MWSPKVTVVNEPSTARLLFLLMGGFNAVVESPAITALTNVVAFVDAIPSANPTLAG
jgi:hypothetical protein